jgi:hypothetical protein
MTATKTKQTYFFIKLIFPFKYNKKEQREEKFRNIKLKRQIQTIQLFQIQQIQSYYRVLIFNYVHYDNFILFCFH